MTPYHELLRESFHALAQPITALRANVELGLDKKDESSATRVLQDCLPLIDRLMQDLALLRETASLDAEPQLDLHDGQELLHRSIEEMAPIAQSGGIALRVVAEPGDILCHAQSFQRAIFLLLDEIIAGAGCDQSISISLCRKEQEFVLEIRPGTPRGLRQKLCRKLMQSAGGCDIDLSDDGISSTFRGCTSTELPARTQDF